jgi:hypothetical protein
MQQMRMKCDMRTYIYVLFIVVNLLQCFTAATNLGLQAVSAVMGESAVVDKETGRIYWEGGSSNTLAESITPKLRSVIGVSHTKATLLTVLLLFAAAGKISQLLRDMLHVLFGDVTRPFLQTMLLSFTRTMLLLPKFPRWLVVSLVVLYVLESYCCSTHKYLTYAVDDAEAYIEQLREHPPIVEWKVRSFHYENYIVSTLKKLLQWSNQQPDGEHIPSLPSLLRWKCVTHTAKDHYSYGSCEDQTIAGVWKRAPILIRQQQPNQPQQHRKVPLTKIVVTKTLLLRDVKTRQDYFAQQRLFLTKEHSDEYAEFSTNVHVDGFQPRMLAIPRSTTTEFHRALLQPYVFWFCTCIGLTVPYRRWFASQCDEVRVRVVKETNVNLANNPGRTWFSSTPASTTLSKVPSKTSSILSQFNRTSTGGTEKNIQEQELHPTETTLSTLL